MRVCEEEEGKLCGEWGSYIVGMRVCRPRERTSVIGIVKCIHWLMNNILDVANPQVKVPVLGYKTSCTGQ